MMRSKPTGFCLILLVPQKAKGGAVPAYSYSHLTNYIPKRTLPSLASNQPQTLNPVLSTETALNIKAFALPRSERKG